MRRGVCWSRLLRSGADHLHPVVFAQHVAAQRDGIWQVLSMLRLFKGLQSDSKCYDMIKCFLLCFRTPKGQGGNVFSGYWRNCSLVHAGCLVTVSSQGLETERWTVAAFYPFVSHTIECWVHAVWLLINESQSSYMLQSLGSVPDPFSCRAGREEEKTKGRNLRAEDLYLYHIL